MAQQHINYSTPNDGLGDTLRTSQVKAESNFTELYNQKVDKETGKSLTDNNFSDADKAKLDGLSNDAVTQSDWNEGDNLDPAYIKNKPENLSDFFNDLPQYLNAVGSFDYSDLATQTTPISITAGVETKLTNDTLGDYTVTQFAPFGISTTYNPATNQFDFSQLSLGDQVEIRTDLYLDLIGTNTSYKYFLKYAIGSVKEWQLPIHNGERKNTDGFQETHDFGFVMNYQETIDYPAELWIKTDAGASLKVNGYQLRITRKDINIIDIAGEAPLATSLVTGTVKTDITETDPIVYTKTTVDGLLADLPTAVFVREANGAIHRADVFDTEGGANSINLTTNTGANIGNNSHADSVGSANGDASHADSGGGANGYASHADSVGSANGDYSHASALGVANGLMSNASGNGATANSYSETAVGTYNENVTAASGIVHALTDLAFSVGIGINSSNRLTAFSIFKNGMVKFLARALSNITNAVKGSFAVDETGRPNVHNGTQWNALAYLSETGGTIDAIPTDGSTNAVSSNGVFDALNTKANADGTILYHTVKWFTPSSTVSNVGATVTSVGTQFTSAMVGAKLIINGEQRIITAFTSSTVVTVDSAYSVNNTGVVAGSWGVYSMVYASSFLVGINNSTSVFFNTTGSIVIQIDVNGSYTVSSSYAIFQKLEPQSSLHLNNGVNFGLSSASVIRWASTTNGEVGTKDLGLRRNASGILEIYNGVTADGTLTNRRDLLLRNLLASKVLVGTTTDNGIDAVQVNGTVSGSAATLSNQFVTKAQTDLIRPYKIYSALISQTGTDAPTVIILENSIGNIVWTRTSGGAYEGTLTGAFTVDKTMVFMSPLLTTLYDIYTDTINAVIIWTGSDNILTKTSIEIRVYP